MPRIERKVIDWDIAEGLARIHCTQAEIISVLRVTQVTLDKHIKKDHHMTYAEWYAKHSAAGKMSIRRKMFDVAEGGNVQMLIWLSKQHLGFREPAVELASKKIEKEEIAKLDDQSLEAVARRILQEDHKSRKGIQLVN